VGLAQNRELSARSEFRHWQCKRMRYSTQKVKGSFYTYNHLFISKLKFIQHGRLGRVMLDKKYRKYLPTKNDATPKKR